jgi:hypothetical protein
VIATALSIFSTSLCGERERESVCVCERDRACVCTLCRSRRAPQREPRERGRKRERERERERERGESQRERRPQFAKITMAHPPRLCTSICGEIGNLFIGFILFYLFIARQPSPASRIPYPHGGIHANRIVSQLLDCCPGNTSKVLNGHVSAH